MNPTDSPRHWARRLIREQPAFVLSGLYLMASLIGLVYSWAFLRGFEVNYLQYAEIGDFLLASMKEPFTWAVVATAMAVVALDNRLSLLVEQRKPRKLIQWYGSTRYRRFNYVAGLVLVSYFLWALAWWNGDRVREGKVEPVWVQLVDEAGARPMVLLDTTVNYVFFYDVSAARVDIHPKESIRQISKPLTRVEP